MAKTEENKEQEAEATENQVAESSQEERRAAAKRQLTQELEQLCNDLDRTMEDVAYGLNISRNTAGEIKNGTLFDKHDRVFAQGYVILFAKELGMDKEAVYNLLNIIYADEPVQRAPKNSQMSFTSDYERETELHNQRKGLLKTLIPITLCLLAFGAVVYWKLYIDSPTSENAISGLPSELDTETTNGVRQPVFTPYIEEEPNETSAEKVEEQNTLVNPVEDGLSIQQAKPAANENKDENPPLEFSFTEESWLEVIDGRGQELAWQLFGPGEKISFRGAPPYEILIGNGKGTLLKYKGEEVVLPINPRDRTARLILPREE